MVLDHTFRRGGKTGELHRRAHGAAHQFATAIGTAPTRQTVASAVDAERALERAHQRLGRVGRQILVTALAVRLQGQHLNSLALLVLDGLGLDLDEPTGRGQARDLDIRVSTAVAFE